MKRWVALLAVCVLFVVGVGVGVLGMHLFHAKEIDWSGGGGPFGGHRFVRVLERELGLTAEQQRRIDEIVDQGRIEADVLHREMLPRVRGQMEQTRQRIREVLTPEQQVKFDELHQRHRRRAEHFFLGRGGRRPHGPRPRQDGPPMPPPPPPGED